jgi:SAM-dependent methyltransferase
VQGSGLVIKVGPVPGYYIGSVCNGVSPVGRRSFIIERRRAAVHRFDTLHSPHYDENWAAISPSRAAFVARLTTLIRPGGDVVDTACGTGKYWSALLAAGLRVTGADQSAGMLAQAWREHPEVPARVLTLQDLAGAGDLRGWFDGLLCVDALENIAPEDWPGAAAGLAAALKPRTPACVAVEVHDGPLPAPGARRGFRGRRARRLPLLSGPGPGTWLADGCRVPRPRRAGRRLLLALPPGTPVSRLALCASRQN